MRPWSYFCRQLPGEVAIIFLSHLVPGCSLTSRVAGHIAGLLSSKRILFYICFFFTVFNFSFYLKFCFCVLDYFCWEAFFETCRYFAFIFVMSMGVEITVEDFLSIYISLIVYKVYYVYLCVLCALCVYII